MFRRVMGIGISRSIKPFIFTVRCTRTWINRANKDSHEPKTELISDKIENFLPEDNERATASTLFGRNPISALFLETKNSEIIISSPSSPTPTK